MAEKTTIVIEGDVTTKVVENRQKKSDGTETVSQTKVSVKTEDWFAKIKEELTPPFRYVIPAMPVGLGRIAAMAEKNGRSVYVVELPPTTRSLRWSYDKSAEGEKLHKVSFPFAYVVQRFVGKEVSGSPYIYFRNAPVLEGEDFLLKPNLPNINSDYRVCWGSSKSAVASQPVNIQLANICQSFWQSQFNKDLRSNFWEPAHGLPGHPKSFEEWEQMTAADPGFILKINWPSSGKTVSQILEWGVKA